jgi:hypothetical protein
MSDYRERTTGEIKSQGEWRRHFSNISLPKVWNSDVEDTLNLDPVIFVFPPELEKHKIAVQNGAEQNAEGQWVIKWSIEDMFKEYTDTEGNTVTVAQQIADSEALELLNVTNGAKERRNMLLDTTDWWAVADRTMTAEQTAYRQALRNITSHANWPHLDEADWPTKP